MKKCPYTFPHRTRRAMIEYLSAHESYVPMNTWNGGFVLAWNIKVYSFDTSGKHGDSPVSDRFDSEWKSHVKNDSDLFNECCADATREYTDKEWTNYPGVEQGDWEFGINGRSGGYMILSDCPAWLSKPSGWACNRMTWDSRGDFQEWLNGLDTETLRKFYRAIRVLDSDLSPAACKRAMEYQFSFRRQEWEESKERHETCNARKQESERPDLYQN